MSDPSQHVKEGITVAAKALTFSVTNRKTGVVKNVLDNVNFICHPSQLFIIMGPSGCGKTSFLNAIAGRLNKKSNTTLEGKILYNGNSDKKIVRQISNYVMQHDQLMEFLTVRETLFYAALIRLPDTPAKIREARIDRLVKELGLVKCLDVYVGGGRIKGISGGQKKRVSIAIEMLDDPPLLFLDEPTSGLDSSLAYDTMKVLVDVAKSGRTVISTVHQPRSQTFALFDQLLLLTTGKVVYHGPANMAQNYFTSIGHPCPKQFNPADYYLDLISPDNATSIPIEKYLPEVKPDKNEKILLKKLTSFMSEGRVVIELNEILKFPLIFGASEMGQSIMNQLKKEENRENIMTLNKNKQSRILKIKNWIICYTTLTRRSFLNAYRNPIITIVQFMVQIIYGLIIGGIFFQLPRNGSILSISKMQASDISSVIFLIAEQYAFSNMDSLFSFNQERVSLNRDTANNLYSPLIFYLSKMTADIFFQHAAVLIFSIIAYAFCGLGNSPGQLFFYLLTGIVCTFSGASYLYMVGTGIPNIQASTIFAPIGATIFLLLMGFFLKDDAIPKWIAWARYLNYLRFAFFALLQNEFRKDEVIGIESGVLDNQHFLQQNLRIPLHLTMWENLAICFALGIFYRIVAFIFLKYLHRNVGLES